MKIKSMTISEESEPNVILELDLEDVKGLANALYGAKDKHKRVYANFAILFDLMKHKSLQDGTIETLK